MRFILEQEAWDCGLLCGVIPIIEAPASSMAFTTEFSCFWVVSAALNALLSSFMYDDLQLVVALLRVYQRDDRLSNVLVW